MNHKNQVLVTAVTDAIWSGNNIQVMKVAFEAMLVGQYLAAGPGLVLMLEQLLRRQLIEKKKLFRSARAEIAQEVGQAVKNAKVANLVKELCGGSVAPGLSPDYPPLVPPEVDSLLAS